MSRLVDVRETVLDALEVEQAVDHTGAGAVVSFIGRVRDHNDGKPVVRLEYEAYPTMAIREMGQLVAAIEARIAGVRLGVIHRTGSLEVGDAAIICAASAAHRSEAFEACRLLIDEVKSRVPIWKREHGPDGPYWVGWEDARCGTGHHHAAPVRDNDHISEPGRHAGEPVHHHCRHSAQATDDSSSNLAGMRVICVTVSDTRTYATDDSGATAAATLIRAGAVVQRQLVRDELREIANAVTQGIAERPDAIVLTGGTGIGPRDVTHDAVLPLFERQIDGFGEAFRRISFEQIGTRGLLSRAVAGTIGRTAIFAIPGSTKAVQLALDSLIIPMLPHARAMLDGGGH